MNDVYTPTLKSKRGEITAIRLLDGSVKNSIAPFLDVLPPNPFATNPRTLDAHLTWVAKQFATAWDSATPVLVDTFDIGPAIVRARIVALEYLCAELLKNEINAIPVTGLQREKAHDLAVARVAAGNQAGICLRLENEDLALPSKLGPVLIDRLSFFRTKPSDVDLIIDLRLINAADVATHIERIRRAIAKLPDVNLWRRLVLTGSSMPNSLNGVCERGATGRLRRLEWVIWNAVRDLGVSRLPEFGDYTTVPPHYVEMNTRAIAKHLGPNVKYTLDGEWFVARGRSFQELGGGQYLEIAQSVAALRGFRGRKASVGDKFIADRASGVVEKPGNPEQWVTASVNSHISWQVRHVP